MRWSDILSLLLTLLLVAILTTFIFSWWDIQVRYEKFEDGSGVVHISYCYPGGVCYDEHNNSDPGFEQLQAEDGRSGKESGEQRSPFG